MNQGLRYISFCLLMYLPVRFFVHTLLPRERRFDMLVMLCVMALQQANNAKFQAVHRPTQQSSMTVDRKCLRLLGIIHTLGHRHIAAIQLHKISVLLCSAMQESSHASTSDGVETKNKCILQEVTAAYDVGTCHVSSHRLTKQYKASSRAIDSGFENDPSLLLPLSTTHISAPPTKSRHQVFETEQEKKTVIRISKCQHSATQSVDVGYIWLLLLLFTPSRVLSSNQVSGLYAVLQKPGLHSGLHVLEYLGSNATFTSSHLILEVLTIPKSMFKFRNHFTSQRQRLDWYS